MSVEHRYPLFLASRSPRRADLLRQIGREFSLLDIAIDERQGVDEPPDDYVRRMAREKCHRGHTELTRESGSTGPAVVLAADTTVVCDSTVLGKPNDPADASVMLTRLSDRVHEVKTAVACATVPGSPDEIEVTLSTTKVWFKRLNDADIHNYVASEEPWDKAGAYAIQGAAAAFVTRIDGSYSGVVGLPLFETEQLLARAYQKLGLTGACS